MNHIPVFQDQTRSTMRQNDPYGPLLPVPLPTLLPTEHPRRKDAGVDKTLEIIEEHRSSMRRSEYEPVRLANDGRETQDASRASREC